MICAMLLTANDLRETGEDLWGPAWPSILAHRLGTTAKTVRCWATGKHGMPEDLLPTLIALCSEQSKALQERRDALVRMSNGMGG